MPKTEETWMNGITTEMMEHICRVLEDIAGKEVKKRVIANKRMWLRKMENKRKQYEPYKGEIKYMIEYGLTIQNIYAAISEESGIDASIETFKNFLKDNDMMPESKKQEASVKDIFGNIANYMEFHEGLSADQLPAQQSGIKSKQGIDAELFTVAMKKKERETKEKWSIYLLFLRTGNYWRLRVHKNKKRDEIVFL